MTNGFRFDGNGVVVLDVDRFRPSKASMVSLKFKTYADNGLMLLVGKDRDFMSLELRDGKVKHDRAYQVLLRTLLSVITSCEKKEICSPDALQGRFGLNVFWT